MSFVIASPASLSQLQSILTGFAGGKIHLFTNNFNPLPSSVLTAFTEATFTGYLAISVTAWGAPFTDVSGSAASVAPSAEWVGPSDASGETIYGFYYTTGAGAGTLQFSGKFDEGPIPLASTANALVLILTYILGATGKEQVISSISGP